MQKCGCGKDGVYAIIRDGIEVYSCNKYNRCWDYDELVKINRQLENQLYIADDKLNTIRKFKELFYELK